MSAVRIINQSGKPGPLILNENKRGEVVLVVPGVERPVQVKPYDLLVGLLEASPKFTKELGDSVRDMIEGYVYDHVPAPEIID